MANIWMQTCHHRGGRLNPGYTFGQKQGSDEDIFIGDADKLAQTEIVKAEDQQSQEHTSR